MKRILAMSCLMVAVGDGLRAESPGPQAAAPIDVKFRVASHRPACTAAPMMSVPPSSSSHLWICRRDDGSIFPRWRWSRSTGPRGLPGRIHCRCVGTTTRSPEFPECEQNVNDTDGVHLRYERRPRWGDFYNLSGKGRGGRLVWLHSQEGDQAADYEIHYRLVAKARPRARSKRRPLVARRVVSW